MYDDIDRIDNVAGMRTENALSPLVRSKRERSHGDETDDDKSRRRRKEPVEDEVILQQDKYESEPNVDDKEEPEDPAVEEEQEADSSVDTRVGIDLQA